MIDEFEHEPSRARGRDIDSDSPGRVHDRFGAARHAMEADTDLKRTEARRFSNELGIYLAKKYNSLSLETRI